MREIKNEYLHMSKNEYLHENNQNLNKNGSMATMAEKMAASLEELRKLQEKDRCVVLQGTAEIGRTHLTRLLDNGWLQEVMKGWYIAARPETRGIRRSGTPHSGILLRNMRPSGWGNGGV